MALVVLLFLVLNWYVAPTQPGERKDLVLAVAQILGGTALISGLYFTWRTLQVNSQGQITERFTRAIDQLGKFDDKREKLFEIRLGGIYALERIARESPEDYWPIMEILTAYVRQNAPRKSDQELRALDPDIEAIITVLRRRTRSYGHGEPEHLNLARTHLLGAGLFQANLSEASLFEANLYGAFLAKADLSGAFLFGANLSEATLTLATLTLADLTRADLTRADLSGAILSGANLRAAILSGADLRGAILYGADLRGAILESAQQLTLEQIEWTIGSNETTVPEGLDRPEVWSKGIEEQKQIVQEHLHDAD